MMPRREGTAETGAVDTTSYHPEGDAAVELAEGTKLPAAPRICSQLVNFSSQVSQSDLGILNSHSLFRIEPLAAGEAIRNRAFCSGNSFWKILHVYLVKCCGKR
jgi:hypothetical protein